MKVAIVVHEFPALSETFVLSHVTGLIDLGHDVTVIADQPRREATRHPDVARYGLERHIIYGDTDKPKWRRALELAKSFLSVGLRHPIKAIRAIRRARETGAIGPFRALNWWARLDGRRSYDVIHAHFGTVGRTAAALRRIGAIEGPLVTTFHGVDMSASLMANEDIYTRLFIEGEAFLPVSEYWRTKLLTLGAPAERTIVQHMGIDTQALAFRPRWVDQRGRGNHPLRALSIGRLVEKKGIEFALEAVARYRNRGHQIVYTIIGDGPLRGELERLIDLYELTGTARIMGLRSNAEVRRLLYQNDVLIAPSVTDKEGDQEGIPVTIMEAMAVGVPVISTLHSGIPELVEHGMSGLLAIERDPEGIALALAELTDTAGFARRLTQNARAKVEREFDLAKLNRRLAEFYESLVRGEPIRVEEITAPAEPETLTPLLVDHPRLIAASRS